MAYNNADMAFTLPNQITPSQVLQQSIQLKEREQERSDALAERQRQFDEREQDRKLANQYKNANLIQEGTDLSSHLTGDAIANNIATASLKDVLPKLYAMSKANGNPNDLAEAIYNWKSKVVPSLDNINSELTLSDKAIKQLKELNPDLDTEAITADYRKDIHNRTVDQNGQLIPAQLVQKSDFQNNLPNPDFLSKYVRTNKNLVEAITNPKGADEATIPTGTQDSHDVYMAKVPHWKAPNYTQEDVVKGGGFLPKGFMPQLKTKGEPISMDKAPDLQGQGNSVMIADKNDYSRFSQDPKTNLELIAATRQMYPSSANRKGYDDFSDVEKEFAKRQVLYNQFENLDRSNFAYKSSLRPQRTTINNAAPKDVNFNDVADQLDKALPKEGIAPITQMPSEARTFLSKSVNEGRREDDKFDISKLGVVKGFDGTYRVVNLDKESDSKDEVVGIFSRTGVNLGTNKGGQKVQEKIIKSGNGNSIVPAADDFNTKWSKLKKGESMVAPDGKTYVKK